MAVRLVESHLKVNIIAYEAKFDDAYRYLDRCGSVISKIRSQDPKWKLPDSNSPMGTLINSKKSISCSMDNQRIGVSRLASEQPLEQDAARKIVDNLAVEASLIYGLVTEAFEIPNTIRIGARFSFIAPADTMEDADRFLVSVARCELLSEIEKSTQSQLYSAHVRYNVEEEETGYRRSVFISSLRLEEGDNPWTGLESGSQQSKCGVQFDVDTFTRPASGHFSDTKAFILNCYSRSFRQAQTVLHWIGSQQKK